MKKTSIAAFDQLCEIFSNAKAKVKRCCLDMLKEICNRTESKEINLDKLKNFLCDQVMYDGGNHPEYATNMYSTVDGFRLNGDTIIFEIEDSTDYDEDRMWTDDLIELCDTIINYEAYGYTLGVSDYGDDE
jgi:hypothetical protein